MTNSLVTKLVSMLSDLAETGALLPTTEGMTDALGVGGTIFSHILTEAQERGLIRTHAKPGGLRRVEIVATGKLTEWTRPCGRHRGKKYNGEALPEDLAKAKQWFMRQGYPIYRAKTAKLSKDPSLWVIGVPNKFYTDAQLMAFARSRGWRAAA